MPDDEGLSTGWKKLGILISLFGVVLPLLLSHLGTGHATKLLTFTGRVLDQTNVPVAGAIVTVAQSTGKSQTLYTDADGNFSVSLEKTDTSVQVAISAKGFLPFAESKEPIQASPDTIRLQTADAGNDSATPDSSAPRTHVKQHSSGRCSPNIAGNNNVQVCN